MKEPIYDDTLFSQETTTAIETSVFAKTVKDIEVPYIKCLVRDKEIKLTPEEAVRQLYIHKLIYEYGYPVSRIQLETPIHFGREVKRADITIMDKDRPMVPYIIVKLKKPNLPMVKSNLNHIAMLQVHLLVYGQMANRYLAIIVKTQISLR